MLNKVDISCNSDYDLYGKLDNYDENNDPMVFKPFKPINATPPTPPKFPVHAMGPLADVVQELAEAIQAPVELVFGVALAAIALPAQALVMVNIDGRVFPPSLFVLIIGESGMRKSETAKHLCRPIRDIEKQLFDSEQKEKSNTSDYHTKNPFYLTSDATAEGLTKSFLIGQKTQALFCAEGAVFTGGYSMRENQLSTLGTLSSLWDGDDIRRRRSTRGEDVFLTGVRLSLCLQLQPCIFAKTMTDSVFRSQGFMGRVLLSKPQTLRGSRFYNQVNFEELVHLPNFQNRLAALLKCGYFEPLKPRSIKLSSEAHDCYVDFYNQVERHQLPGGKYEPVLEVASKSAENAARIAAVFQIWSDPDALCIGRQCMEDGMFLAQYYLDSHLSIECPIDYLSHEDLKLALSVWGFIKKFLGARSEKTLRRADFQSAGPHKLRVGGKYIGPVQILCDHGYLRVTDVDKAGEPMAWEANRVALNN